MMVENKFTMRIPTRKNDGEVANGNHDLSAGRKGD
jgi:hypothetical protein